MTIKITYSNLNHKSHYSTGIAVGSTTEIIKKALEKGLSSIALTDRSTISGLLDFYNKGKELKFPVVLGTEIFYYNNNNKIGKIVLLAINQDGYTNLCKLITASWNNLHLFNQPIVSLYDLNELNSNLYCLASKANQYSDLNGIFKDKLVFQLSISKKDIESNREILNLKTKMIFTCDSYIPDWDYKDLQDVMLSNAKNLSEEEKIIEPKPILSATEILKLWKVYHTYISLHQVSECFNLSNKIAEECSKIVLKFKDQVVNFPHKLHPLNLDGCSKEELVWRIAKQYGRLKDSSEYLDRFKYEMDSICNNSRVNLIDYFLVLEDLCRACRENNITVGPGRGSGAGSLVNYCLRVTNLDPIETKLLFERFISKGRIEKGTLPDVDLDFSDQEWVRNYLREKYGDDRVIRIGTFQTLKTAGSIKDICKSLLDKYPELDFKTVNNITSKFDTKDLEESELEYFERNVEENDVIKEFFQKYSDIKDKVERLIGYNRQPGAHPCGTAITQDNIASFAPLRDFKGTKILELNASACEQSGIIKYDILGLKTLKYIQSTCDLVGIKDIYSIPLNDKKTFENFINGDTNGVFQYNSDVSVGILRNLILEKMHLDILSMTTSVGRPGPMGNGQHVEFFKRVRGEKFATPPHWSLEEELKETYGIMIYQENVMKASQILGGFSLAEADDIRKAMGKKKASLLTPYKSRFIEHCEKKYPDTKHEYIDEEGKQTGITKANHIWDLMATFSGYGFCKAHAMSYALIGYQCQYLKTHYPLEWWTSCLTHAGDEKLAQYYSDAQQYCLDPDINKSENNYVIVDGKIQMPISAIKGLGPKAVEEIYTKRPFNSFEHFFEKVSKTKINKNVVAQLIFAGCFDQIENKTKQEMIKFYYENIRKEELPKELVDMSKTMLLNKRIKALIYLQENLYEIYESKYSPGTLVKYENIKYSDKMSSVLGFVDKLEIKKTKNGNPFGTLHITNDGQDLKFRVWSDELDCYKDNLKLKNKLKINFNTTKYNESIQLTLVSCELLGDG